MRFSFMAQPLALFQCRPGLSTQNTNILRRKQSVPSTRFSRMNCPCARLKVADFLEPEKKGLVLNAASLWDRVNSQVIASTLRGSYDP